MFIEKFTDEQLFAFRFTGTEAGTYRGWFESNYDVKGFISVEHSRDDTGLSFDGKNFFMLVHHIDKTYSLLSWNNSYEIQSDDVTKCITGERLVIDNYQGKLIVNPEIEDVH